AARFGDRDALVFPALRYRRSYAEFHEDVRQLARALLAFGVQRGEHIALWATNLPQWVVVQFAAANIGACLGIVNHDFRGPVVANVQHKADVTTLLLTYRLKSSDYFDILGTICPELASSVPGALHAAAYPRLRRVISLKPDRRPGMLTWDEMLGRAAEIPET